MTDESGRPDRVPRILRINPGSLPEAASLQELSIGLAQVRDRIRRETVGAVSPRRQLLAVDAIMQRHHDGIAGVFRAARERNDRVLSAADTYGLVLSLLEHVTMASYWLLLAWRLRRLPSQDRPDLSVTKSREKRHAVLRRIRTSCQIAGELIDGLTALVPPNENIKGAFRSIALQMLCIQISATRHALFSASKRKPLPREKLEAMLGKLDVIRLEPDFAERPASDRYLLWQTATMLYDDLGDDLRLRAAFKEQRSLTADDPDALAALLVQMMEVAQGDEDRFALINELTRLGKSSEPGALFSQDRIGRVSVFRDALWSVATSTGSSLSLAAPGIDEALVCYRTWTFGNSVPLGKNTVRLLSDWAGGGRVRWEANGADQVREFELDPELVEKYFFDREATRSLDRGAAVELTRFLDRVLGPTLTEAIKRKDEVRIQAGGSIALLPLLMTMIGDGPLGASTSAAYAHPNPDVEGGPVAPAPFELLIVDDCFADDSARVRSALQLSAERSSVTFQMLRFNSEEQGMELAHRELEDALESVSSALLFCHVDTPAMYAGEVAIVTGPASRFRVDALAALDLRSLNELALIGCASGRANLFVGDVTVAHAAAMAGARQILYSLWPIRAKYGSKFASELANAVGGQGMAKFLADEYRSDRKQAGSFAIIRP